MQTSTLDVNLINDKFFKEFHVNVLVSKILRKAIYVAIF